MIKKEKIRDFIMEIGYIRLILLGICGVFLIIVSMPEQKEEIIYSEGSNVDQNIQNGNNDIYVEKMEKKLEETLEKIKGVGNVEVMITLFSSAETVVNKDTSYENSTETEGGENNKNAVSSVMEEKTVMTEEDGEQKPYIIKEFEPVVEGVIVVMEGGDNSLVINSVTEAVQALFSVEAHKIKVLKMEDES